MTSCKVILNSLNTLLGLNFTGTYFLDFGKKVFRGVGFIFAISKTKYEKTALNLIQAFSTSFYFSKSLNIFTILKKKTTLTPYKFYNIRTTLQILQQDTKWNLLEPVNNKCICPYISCVGCCYYMSVISSWFDFSIWVFNFACLNFARIQFYSRVFNFAIFSAKFGKLKTCEIKY